MLSSHTSALLKLSPDPIHSLLKQTHTLVRIPLASTAPYSKKHPCLLPAPTAQHSHCSSHLTTQSHISYLLHYILLASLPLKHPTSCVYSLSHNVSDTHLNS